MQIGPWLFIPEVYLPVASVVEEKLQPRFGAFSTVKSKKKLLQRARQIRHEINHLQPSFEREVNMVLELSIMWSINQSREFEMWWRPWDKEA